MRHLYTTCFYAALPFIYLRLLWKSKKFPSYKKRFKERLGIITSPQLIKHKTRIKGKIKPRTVIWIHAVSLGESIAAAPLISTFKKLDPRLTIIVTTNTQTGAAQIKKTFKESVVHQYVPYDIPKFINRFLDIVSPNILIIMETELWPNIIHFTHKRGIPILLANARLSQRSLKKYRYIKPLSRDMISKLSAVAAQSQTDAKRFLALGLESNKITITGNIKYDLRISDAIPQAAFQLRKSWHRDNVIIAASTHYPEEMIIIKAFANLKKKYPKLLLILVPRHPDRAARILTLCKNFKFDTITHSQHNKVSPTTDIYLVDTTGELLNFYGTSDIAFVGGSLTSVGGHNLIEPAALQLPILSGPNLHNFKTISDRLLEREALMLVKNEKELYHKLLYLIKNKDMAQQIGERAYTVNLENQGALKNTLQTVQSLLKKRRNH